MPMIAIAKIGAGKHGSKQNCEEKAARAMCETILHKADWDLRYTGLDTDPVNNQKEFGGF